MGASVIIHLFRLLLTETNAAVCRLSQTLDGSALVFHSRCTAARARALASPVIFSSCRARHNLKLHHTTNVSIYMQAWFVFYLCASLSVFFFSTTTEWNILVLFHSNVARKTIFICGYLRGILLFRLDIVKINYKPVSRLAFQI